MLEFDRNWWWFWKYHTNSLFKEQKRINNAKYYRENREKILEQKRESYQRRKKMEELEEKIDRISKIVAINNKSLRTLKPLIKTMAKQIGMNSNDVRKMIGGLKEHLDLQTTEDKENNTICRDNNEIRRFYL